MIESKAILTKSGWVQFLEDSQVHVERLTELTLQAANG
jgi:hypothetical protein